MSSPFPVAGIQMPVDFAVKASNLDRVEAHLRTAAGNGARLVVFPECVLTGYCFESLEEARAVAEPIPGPSIERMAAVCDELDVYVVFGLLEQDSERMFNACALVGPSGLIASYRKIHLPYLGIDRFATPGDRPFAVHDVGEVRVGMNICYDCSFPESARIMALAGADLIVLPTNWPPGAQSVPRFTVQTRAQENRVYFMAVNRIGTERGFRFIGNSKILDVDGTELAAAEHENEEILYAEIDVRRARNKHIVRVPGQHEIDRFRDRRPDMYGPIGS